MCAQSNAAVDELVSRLDSRVPIFTILACQAPACACQYASNQTPLDSCFEHAKQSIPESAADCRVFAGPVPGEWAAQDAAACARWQGAAQSPAGCPPGTACCTAISSLQRQYGVPQGINSPLLVILSYWLYHICASRSWTRSATLPTTASALTRKPETLPPTVTSTPQVCAFAARLRIEGATRIHGRAACLSSCCSRSERTASNLSKPFGAGQGRSRRRSVGNRRSASS